MDKQDYLRNLREFLKPAQNMIGMPLEKNAMNYVPTEQEAGQMQGQIAQVSAGLEEMERTARGNAEAYREKCERYAIEGQKLSEAYTALCGTLDNMVKKLSEKQAESAKRQAEMENVRYVAQCAQVEKKKLERRKSTGADYRAVLQNIMDREKQIQEMERQYRDGWNVLMKLREEESRIRREKEENEGQQKKTLEQLEKAKEEMCYWEEMAMKMQKLKSRLSASTLSPDTLLEVMELLEQMEAV